MSNVINHMDTTPYEEFGDKYLKLNQFTNLPSPYQALPFINTKYREHGMFYLDVKSLARISDGSYGEIQGFPDYDYTNSIAYEMLIRTSEYMKLQHATMLTEEERISSYQKLGITLSEFNRFNLKRISKYYHNRTVNTDFQSYCDVVIVDIEEGLTVLIDYYVKKKQIYTIAHKKKNSLGLITKIEYKREANITVEKIISSLSNYFIPAKYDYENYTKKSNKCRLGFYIPLGALTDAFLTYIEEKIPREMKSKVSFTWTRPILRFQEAAIVDLPINLNLSTEELTALILKLKKEYANGHIKTAMDLLYNKHYKAVDWKAHAPFKVTKVSMAQAFFVYDLYMDIADAFETKKKQLDKSKDQEISDVKIKYIEKIGNVNQSASLRIKSLSTDLKERAKIQKGFRLDADRAVAKLKKKEQEEIKIITHNYKEQAQVFNTLDVVTELVSEHNITRYMCKKYLQFMREFIDRSKYKELIIGTKNIL